MNFWSFFWLLVWAFVFMSYLMVLFQVVVDVFRDRTISGVQRAIWVIGLIAVPVLTALVYLIVRGQAMGERQQAAVAGARAAQEDYVRSLAGSTSPADQIVKAKSLLDSGAISADEYVALKAKALA
ncbi:MAG TPA: SHOCT domain-containing protein [Propionibacteriaceae bacterium]|nr:SHOCT domain-containing protein [Propionibacteriaceae bacterium]